MIPQPRRVSKKFPLHNFHHAPLVKHLEQALGSGQAILYRDTGAGEVAEPLLQVKRRRNPLAVLADELQ